MKKYIIPSFLLLSFFCFSGCGGKKKPSDLPPLHPVKITVLQDGVPVDDATVNLVADGKDVRFTTSGVTDKNGVVTIKTDIDWPGAPAGKYKVCISKKIVSKTGAIDQSLSMEEQRAQHAAMLAGTKSVVDAKYLRPNTTDLVIEVTTSGATETFDVGPAVDELWNDVVGGSGGRR